MPGVAKQYGVSAQMIYCWRKHFGTLEPADVKGLRQLAQENGGLRRWWPTEISRSKCPRKSREKNGGSSHKCMHGCRQW